MTSVLNKTEQVITDYNKPILDLLFSERNYSKGNTRQFDTAAKELLIVGKPQAVEDRLKALFDLVIDDIDFVNDKNDSGFHFIRQLY
jgi:alkanesulfonate monooxygenase SsuD/methylene tetrahydromethanopterin reductase-like flavin-dependent oxidoreductase (luciferase family)